MSSRSSSRSSIRSTGVTRSKALDRSSKRSSVQNLIRVFDSESSRESSPDNKRSFNMTESELNVASATRVIDGLSSVKVTSRDVSELVRSIESMRGSLIDWISGNVAFAGFDALEMREKLTKNLNGKQIILGVIVGLVRGNNIERIKTSMRSSNARKDFLELITAAKLKARVGGDYKAVTLSRIIACFPEVVCEILHHHTNLPMAVDHIQLVSIHREYPAISRHQVAACIVPLSLGTSTLSKILDVFMVPYLMTSEQINQKNGDWKKKTKQTRAIESSTYLNNSYHSKVFNEEDRKQLSIKFGILTGDSLSSMWEAVSVKATQWLTKNYDFSHTNVEI